VLLELLGQGKRATLAHHLCQHRQQWMSVWYSTGRTCSSCKLLCMQQAVPCEQLVAATVHIVHTVET
jgi:hypothetical protein